MGFLTPALLGALLAVAIPVLVHVVQRERRRVVAFPSLMFLRRVPVQAVRRRAIRDWPLLALRILALALIIAAFARPYVAAGGRPLPAAGGLERFVLLDRSMSMGSGDRWPRAQAAATREVTSLGPGDRGTLLLFDADVEIGPRSALEAGALAAAVAEARPTTRGTRIDAAIRAASGLIEQSPMPRREVVLVSDFQRTGWDPARDARLPAGVPLRLVPLSEADEANAAVVGLSFERDPAAAAERVTTTARVANHSTTRIDNRELVLEVDGHRVADASISIEPGATGEFVFPPFNLGRSAARVLVRLAPDQLPADDVFHAVVAPGARLPVLILEGQAPAPDASLYLARALDVAADPAFAVRVERAGRATAAQIDQAAVVVLNDTAPPGGAVGRALVARVQAGAGLWVACGERSAWGSDDPDLLPGSIGAVVDRSGSDGGLVVSVEASHPVFEPFTAPRSGGIASARVYRYRRLSDASGIVARFDDGAVALAERRVGRGRVMIWTSSLDGYWTDLALKPVFVPFVLQTMAYLAQRPREVPWLTVGDPDPFTPADAPASGAGPGNRGRVPAAGFHEDPRAGASGVIAANPPPEESDLALFDPRDVVAAASSPAASAPPAAWPLRDEDVERRQAVWWYLLAAGVCLLAAESAVAGRRPKRG